jgi:hypothetical protein
MRERGRDGGRNVVRFKNCLKLAFQSEGEARTGGQDTNPKKQRRTAIRLLNICWNADPLSSAGESRTKVLPYQNNNPYELKLMNWDIPNVIPFSKPLFIPSSIGRCKACEYKDNNLLFIPNAVTVLIPEIACTATAPL